MGSPTPPTPPAPQPPAPTPPAPTPPAPDPNPPTPPAPRTFSQDEVTAIATREAQAAERAAQQKLLEALGVQDIDSAKQILEAQRVAEEAGKTQLQRDQEAAAAAKAAAEAEKAAAAAERFEARIERAFASAGVVSDGTPESDAKIARIRRMVTVDATADYAAVKAEVDAIKTDFPALFGASDGTPPPPPPSNPKGGPPPTPPGGKSALERGRERAKQEVAASSPGGGYLTPPGL